MSTLSRKHYEAFQKLINEHSDTDYDGIHLEDFVSDLMDYLEEDNPRFDRILFLKGCGLE